MTAENEVWIDIRTTKHQGIPWGTLEMNEAGKMRVCGTNDMVTTVFDTVRQEWVVNYTHNDIPRQLYPETIVKDLFQDSTLEAPVDLMLQNLPHLRRGLYEFTRHTGMSNFAWVCTSGSVHPIDETIDVSEFWMGVLRGRYVSPGSRRRACVV